MTRRAITRIAIARLVSDTGNSAAAIALSIALFHETGSIVWVSAGLLVAYLTPAVVSPLAGAIGDRVDRLSVMVASELAGALCFVALIVVDSAPSLLALGFLAALAASPFRPASSAVLPELVPRAELPSANARVAAAASVGDLTGPLLGGLLVATAGPGAVFGLNAVSFVASAALVTSAAGARRAEGSASSPARGLWAGFRVLFGDPLLRAPAVGFIFVDFGSGIALPAPLALSDVFGSGATGYGLIVGAMGIGTIGGTVVARVLLARRSERAVLVGAAAGLTIAYGACALAPALEAAAATFALAGIMLSATGVAEHVLIQRRAQAALLGRVFAAHFAVIQLSMAAPLLLAGVFIDRFGVRPDLGLAAAFCAIGTLVMARNRTTIGGRRP